MPNHGVVSALDAVTFGCMTRLFAVAQPDTTEKDFLEELKPDSLKVVDAYVEPSLAKAKGDDKSQFERHGVRGEPEGSSDWGSG